VRSRLAPGGRFIFTVPHHFCLYPPWKSRFTSTKGRDYFAGVDVSYEGYIWRDASRSREYSTDFADYFNGLAAAGFKTLPKKSLNLR